MARTITITLPDPLQPRLEEIARDRGVSLEQAALGLLTERLARVPTLPTDPEQLRRELMLGLEGEPVVMTREDWERKAQELIERHRRSKAG
ncbi:MAG: hypothetical protein R3B68_02500 [Phycisphaerales bacterium]